MAINRLPHTRLRSHRPSFRIWILCCQLMLANAVVAEPVGPAQMLSDLTDEVLAKISENPGLLEDDGKVRELAERLILPNIDFRTASQWVLGRYWNRASPQQREAFVSEFRDLLVNTYLHSLGKYKDHKMRVLDERPGQPAGRALVDAQVNQPDGPVVKLMFRLHNKADRWLVYDIVVEGISLVATHRSGFAGEIRNNGLDSLIAHLAMRNDGKADAPVQPAQESP